MDNELLLFDRIEIIKTANQKYDLENNGYLSFSGGKDSTILHYLLDVALPGNRIPRVFIDTGIEYKMIKDFAMGLAQKDDRFQIIKPSVSIKPMLEKEGYPFKSKEFARRVYDYNKCADVIDKYKDMPTEEMKKFMMENKELERSLIGKGIFIIYYLHDLRAKRDKEGYLIGWENAVKFSCPAKLKFMFSKDYGLKINNQCCQRLKKDPVHKWEKQSGRTIAMTGMRRDEGGQRANIQGCILTDKKGRVNKFHPLLVVDDGFEDWFVDKYQIRLCELYYPPFNFRRTGCKGCPFALDLQDELTKMQTYLPAERQQCELIWKPIYDEYRRLGYRLDKFEQLEIF